MDAETYFAKQASPEARIAALEQRVALLERAGLSALQFLGEALVMLAPKDTPK